MKIDNQTINNLAHDKGWKGDFFKGVVALLLCAVISSSLFTVLRGLVEFVLLIGGIGLIGYAGYLYLNKKN